jgi:hypothetical protein
VWHYETTGGFKPDRELMKERSMKRILRDERGIALAVAIFALVIVGALVAGAFFAGTQEQRVGENQRFVQRSFGVAEAGVGERLVSWKPDSLNTRPLWPDTVRIGPNLPTPGRTGSYGGYSFKLGTAIFLIDITGRDTRSAGGSIAGGGGAQQRIGLISRLAPVEFNIRAAVTTQGGVNVDGNAQVNGADQNPTGWTSCDMPGAPQAGVRDKGGTVTTGGNGTVLGSPPVVNDPTLNDSSFTKFGHNSSYADLAARANITLPGGTYQTQPVSNGGTCDKTVLTNWGDGMNAAGPCATYFPVIHLTGTTTLNGDQGQGILLVDGDLDVQGSYQFFGIVVIQGDLKTAGGGTTDAHFWGGVMAKNADLTTQNFSGRATMNFSSCAIINALQSASPLAMMRSRGWTQLY